MAKKKEKFVQVGVTAIRDPFTGAFVQSTPLYVKVTEGAEELEKSMAEDLGRVFAHQMRDYIRGCQEAGVQI